MNTNNNMAVVTKITKNHIHVISDKGIIYRLKVHTHEVNYRIVDNSPQEVFDAFPKSKLFGSYEKKMFADILKEYANRNIHYSDGKKRLLLII
jgi:hypothetical protein